jgi:hypothetical protein
METAHLIAKLKINSTITLPSAVTAAKTVDEYGAHATSPTALPRSKVNTGSLKQESNDNLY